MNKNYFEPELKKMILKYTRKMKWRKDFKEWENYRIWQENYQNDKISLIVKHCKNLDNKAILDLGCGMGGLSISLVKKGYNVVALDLNKDYCKITKLRGHRYGIDMKMVNSLGEFMPFKNESFDIVLCFDVLEHVKNPWLVLREIHRVLKLGGKVFVNVINRYAFKDPHYHLKLINWVPRKVAEFYLKRLIKIEKSNYIDNQKLSEMHYFTYRNFTELISRLGYEVVETKKLKNKFLIREPLYSIIRNFYLPSFNLILIKK